MTLGDKQWAGRKWVLTERPFQERDGKLVTGLRIPGVPRESMAPGIIFELSEEDCDAIDFAQWVRKGRVYEYVEPPKPEPKPKRARRVTESEEFDDGQSAW